MKNQKKIEQKKEVNSQNIENNYIDIELWKDIPQYEGLYQISSWGRCRSLDRELSCGRKLKGKLLSIAKHSEGYYKVKLSKDGVSRNYMVHRLVAQAFVLIEGGVREVHHKDSNKENNRAENLQWVTRSENVYYAYENGEKKKKLSDENVRFIRKHYKAYDEKYGAKALAKRFNVSATQIHNIVSGRSQNKDNNFKKKIN